MLFFGIPIINALFDWPSWWVSRWLMARLRDDALRPRLQRRIGALALHLLLDGALALACLFGLAIIIANLAHGIEAAWEYGRTTAPPAPPPSKDMAPR